LAEVPTRCCMCGHSGTVLVGEFVEFLAAGATDRLDDVAGLVANLLAIAEKEAGAAGRAKGPRIGEMGLPRMRRADLVREHVGVALRKVRSPPDHLGPPLCLPLAGTAKIARAMSIRLMFCQADEWPLQIGVDERPGAGVSVVCDPIAVASGACMQTAELEAPASRIGGGDVVLHGLTFLVWPASRAPVVVNVQRVRTIPGPHSFSAAQLSARGNSRSEGKRWSRADASSPSSRWRIAVLHPPRHGQQSHLSYW